MAQDKKQWCKGNIYKFSVILLLLTDQELKELTHSALNNKRKVFATNALFKLKHYASCTEWSGTNKYTF